MTVRGESRPRWHPIARVVVMLTLVSVTTFLVSAQCSIVAADGPGPPVPGAGLGDEANRPWVFSRLAQANDLLRQRRPRAAARAFRDVYLEAQGTEWATLAELGMAWSAAMTGDLETARALAKDAHASAGIASSTASVVFGLLSAKSGDHAAALTSLDASLATAPQPSERNVVRLAKAYVLFWSGQIGRAAGEFDALAAADRNGPLADDARYGAAWSRLKTGERARAISELTALVADAPAGFHFRPVGSRLVELDERAILGDHARRYRHGGLLQAPDAQLTQLLDSDGFSRARAALKLLDTGRAGTDNLGTRTATEPASADAPDRRNALTQPAPRGAAPAATSGGARTPPSSRWAVGLAFAIVGIASYVAWARRRQQR